MNTSLNSHAMVVTPCGGWGLHTRIVMANNRSSYSMFVLQSCFNHKHIVQTLFGLFNVYSFA